MERLSTLKTINFNYFYHGQDWSYQKALSQQLAEASQIQKNEVSLLAGEHRSVYSLGKSLSPKDFPATIEGVPCVPSDRGGRVMYHGPGQLTLYPVFYLRDFFSGPKDYTCFIFDISQKVLKKHWGLNLYCFENGLWLNEKKVGFLGLRISKGVVYHGLSLNYNVNLEAFARQAPCNIRAEQSGNLLPPKANLNLEREATIWAKTFRVALTKRLNTH